MQRARDADERLAGRGLQLAVVRRQQRLAFGEEIAHFGAAGAAFLIFLTAPAVIERLLAGDAHAIDLAAVGTGLALEGILPVGTGRQVPAFEAAGHAGPRRLARHQRAADGAGHFMVLGDGDRLAGHLLEGGHHRAVEGGAALEEDMLADPSLAHHAVEVVLHDGIGQAGGQIRGAGAARLEADQVGFHEHGAALAQAHRRRRGQGQPGEFLFDADAQPFRLLFEEAAGAGGARLVHLEVDDGALLQADIFGVLPADLENGIDARVDLRGGARLRGDLVFHLVGAEEIADEVAPGAGGAYAAHIDALRPDGAYFAQSLTHRLDGSPGGHQITFGQHAFLFVDEHHIGADGADIDAEIGINDLTLGHLGQMAAGRRPGVGQRRVGAPLFARLLEVAFQYSQIRCAVARAVLAREQRSAHRAGGGGMLGHQEIFRRQLEQLAESAHHALVAGDAAVEGDGRDDLLPARHHGDEVAREGEAEAGNDIAQRGGLLLQVNHVCFGEDAAAPGDARRVLGGQRLLAEFAIDIQPQSAGLLIEEGTAAGGAQAVHGEIADAHRVTHPRLLQRDEARIFSPTSMSVRTRGVRCAAARPCAVISFSKGAPKSTARRSPLEPVKARLRTCGCARSSSSSI